MKFTGLIIMDGYGINEFGENNAISQSTSPEVLKILKEYPNTQLSASGLAVGLPEGQMGNSEVGHLNIGAGRVIFQDLPKITKAIQDGDFYTNKALLNAMQNAKKKGSLHVMGLVSDGGVHSHLSHLFATVKMAKEVGVKQTYIHCFMDGRDVSPTSGKSFVEQVSNYLKDLGYGKIATISGRFYAMDRDNIWERVSKAYSALVDGEGVKEVNPVEAMQNSYDKGVTDEFMLPTVICENGKPVATIKKGDSVIFFNYRPDRARQITRSFIFEDFTGFERKKGFLAPVFVSFTTYDATFEGKLEVAFKKEQYKNTLGEYLASKGIKQFRIAETQKYAHVTFFFNGGVEAPNKDEDRILIDSPKIATFDMKPEMSAYEVCDKACEVIKSGKYGVMILNFANCDMVGHTGVMSAAQKAVKVTDECVRKVLDAILEVGGQALLTADHGNCDYMFDPVTKAPFTAHTTNPVPFAVIGADGVKALAGGGKLCDIAPTMLDIMGIEIPKEMTGKSLIVR
ncbi:MAG: 2,3-bisphosphoglycerate-independent phosphoglycerate mutase [Clostridia bacterium]|nr:2,3-bisphosphoglycerate-independent phosphoglycerate mutase [Clostridia bacterium]MDE7328896.1 2,3-bisphosphoglycerate-independent phosphoglycerate mutase [Clostridia bacterium]